jgi:chromate transporter
MSEGAAPSIVDPPNAGAPKGLPSPPSYADLFIAFARVSLSAFGGALPWARRMFVEDRRWLTAEEFNNAYALCQFLPGPNLVNLAVVFGARVRGVWGSLAAVSGFIGPPFAIILAFAVLYQRFGDLAALRRALIAMAAAAGGMMIATAAKMAAPIFRSRTDPAPLIALGVFTGIAVLRWPLPWVLAVLVPLSVLLAWLVRR